MKALSFRQPWAELILQGRKTMDLRTYNSHHRGLLAIYASQTIEVKACRQHDLDPATLLTGGIVGVVEVVDVLPLSAGEYVIYASQHLEGRPFEQGIYGWMLKNPQRLPEMVPAHGRMSIFNVDLNLDTQVVTIPPPLELSTTGPHTKLLLTTSKLRKSPLYQTTLNGNSEDRPFTLHVKSLAGNSTDYALMLEQRILEVRKEERSDPSIQPGMLTVSTLSGDTLRAIADHVIEALRQAGYKATDLSPTRTQPFYLPESVGVRLGVVMMAVRPINKHTRIEAISEGIRKMPEEEFYYWYSKCTARDSAERAQKALRMLLADE